MLIIGMCCASPASALDRVRVQDYKSIERLLANPAGLSQQELQEKRQHLGRCKQVRP